MRRSALFDKECEVISRSGPSHYIFILYMMAGFSAAIPWHCMALYWTPVLRGVLYWSPVLRGVLYWTPVHCGVLYWTSVLRGVLSPAD
jgi:hypothetical protein